MTPDDVRRLRESVGMTQQEMADYLGLRHRSQVNHLESGRTKVSGPVRLLLEQLGGKKNPGKS